MEKKIKRKSEKAKKELKFLRFRNSNIIFWSQVLERSSFKVSSDIPIRRLSLKFLDSPLV